MRTAMAATLLALLVDELSALLRTSTSLVSRSLTAMVPVPTLVFLLACSGVSAQLPVDFPTE
jgi:hypothetical protein